MAGYNAGYNEDEDDIPNQDQGESLAAKIKKAKKKDPEANGPYDKPQAKDSTSQALDDVVNQIISESENKHPKQPAGGKALSAPVSSDKKAAAAQAKAPPPQMQPALQIAQQRSNQEAQQAYMAAKLKAMQDKQQNLRNEDMQQPAQGAAIRSPQAQQAAGATGVTPPPVRPAYLQGYETEAPAVQEPEVDRQAIMRNVSHGQASGDAKVRSYIDEAAAKSLRRAFHNNSKE